MPLALGSAALFGATLPTSKLLLVEVSPLLLASILSGGRTWSVHLQARSVTHCTRGGSDSHQERRRVAGRCGDLRGHIAAVPLVYGLAATDASMAPLLLNLEGLAAMVIAWVVLRENVDSRVLLGAASILVGAILLTWDGKGLTIDAGALLVGAACLAWGIDNT